LLFLIWNSAGEIPASTSMHVAARPVCKQRRHGRPSEQAR
jgi:hypothetical protein